MSVADAQVIRLVIIQQCHDIDVRMNINSKAEGVKYGPWCIFELTCIAWERWMWSLESLLLCPFSELHRQNRHWHPWCQDSRVMRFTRS